MATEAQIEAIADDIRISQENYGLAFPTPENPLIQECATLRRELEREKKTEPCPGCFGSGMITVNGPYHNVTSQCWICRGSGKVYPNP